METSFATITIFLLSAVSEKLLGMRARMAVPIVITIVTATISSTSEKPCFCCETIFALAIDIEDFFYNAGCRVVGNQVGKADFSAVLLYNITSNNVSLPIFTFDKDVGEY